MIFLSKQDKENFRRVLDQIDSYHKAMMSHESEFEIDALKRRMEFLASELAITEDYKNKIISELDEIKSRLEEIKVQETQKVPTI